MTQAQPIITASRVEAYVASALRLLGWLLSRIMVFSWRGRGACLKRVLSRVELAVECTLFLKAVARFGPPPQRKRHPRSTPPGFRRSAPSGAYFFKSARIRVRKASALDRVTALIEALANPERAVRYFFKRICKGLRLSRLVAVAPPADALVGHVDLAATAFADTS
jgi:hypothetical protein